MFGNCCIRNVLLISPQNISVSIIKPTILAVDCYPEPHAEEELSSASSSKCRGQQYCYRPMPDITHDHHTGKLPIYPL